MKISAVGKADVNGVQNVERAQRKTQNQVQQIQRNENQRNKTERAIDRMAKIGMEMKNSTNNRINTFYKAVRKSMFDFMG